jgi:hypothetical protein
MTSPKSKVVGVLSAEHRRYIQLSEAEAVFRTQKSDL